MEERGIRGRIWLRVLMVFFNFNVYDFIVLIWVMFVS